jgi:hypothetical protein
LPALNLHLTRQRPLRETDEWLSEESAGEFSAALDKYCAAHTFGRIKRPKKRMVLILVFSGLMSSPSL